MDLRAQDASGFAQAMFVAELASYRRAGGASSPVIFDRGLADIVGFLMLEDLAVTPAIDTACRELRYDGPIFRAVPWRDIYHQDDERIQSWEEAIASDRAVREAWRSYGYDLVDLPLAPVEERADFVIERLG